jgi:amino acid adenylation domain-containing protein
MGAGRNDRVATIVPNGPEMAVAFIAVAAGATSAPLNPAYRENEFDFYLSDLNPKALMIQSGIDSPASSVAKARGIPIIELSPVLEAEAGVFTLTGEQGPSSARHVFAAADDVALVLHTSGTTSRPKIVPLTQTNICTSAHNIRRALELVEGDRCLNVMPLFHIHGLLGATLSSLMAGASIVCTPGFYAPQFFEWMEAFRPTWYTAVPTMHQAILEYIASKQEIIARYPLRFIRSSSAALPPKVMAALERVFNVPVIESYGMTEAAHQMASNPLPPHERKPGSVGVAAGSEIAIMDDEGNTLPLGEAGEIVIRGANVTHGYEDNPTANKRAFTNGWFRTGDQGFLDTDGYLFITGRIKEIINRGGEKISPREVDEVLLDHPAIAQAVTFGAPHAKLGEDVIAAVVLRENTSATQREIRDLAFSRLADYKVPSQIVIVGKIPKGPTGKLQRIGLAEKLASKLKAEFAAPRNPVERALARIWTEVLGIEQVGIYDNFFALGGDSLLATQVISRVRVALLVEMPLGTIFKEPTVADLAAIIQMKPEETPRVLKDSPRFLADESHSARRVCPTNPFVEFRKEDIEGSIPDRFEQQVAKYPDRIALKTDGHELTYHVLNQAANRVARVLRAQSGTEEPVALLLKQGAPVVAAILGVLKAGKIFVPLDASFPRARMSYMLEDSQAGLIVTDNQNLALAQELAQNTLQVINIDDSDSRFSTENIGLSISPDSLAYIIYTSGSTGQPKGVPQNHRNILHNTRNFTNDVHVCAEDRLTLLYSPSVSGGVRDIFRSLLNGAAIYPWNVKEEGMANLANWLVQEEITIYNSVATFFRHFASALTGEEGFPKLRLIHIGGGPVYKNDVELYRKHFSQDCIFVNRFGLTETHTVRMYFIDKETELTGSMVPVGYPLADKEVLLLDDTGKAVGFNQVGEIAVKSRYLSPGYWRRPDLTQAKFLPTSNGGDERIFLTGDVGRMMPDGCLVHLGRKDFQVKVRGYSIELAEIEMVLINHPAIKDVVVIGQRDPRGEQRLVAYFVPSTRPAPTATTLRHMLAEILPDYMSPSAFVMLDALPMTPNGKVDRGSLPSPGSERPQLDSPFIAPRTPVEEMLAGIWGEILGIAPVGIHDNFFDLGGNSLLATQVISGVRNTFQVELPLRFLFEAPIIADMGVVITKSPANTTGNEALSRRRNVSAVQNPNQKLLTSDVKMCE